MHVLEPVLEHRVVNLVQDILPDVHTRRRIDAEDVRVEGGMVDLAEAQTIRGSPLG